MSDSDYKIKITTTADASGANAAASALGKVGEAAGGLSNANKAAGEESKKTTTILEQLGSRGGEARDVIEGLEAAAHGGTGGLLGMAKAARALNEGLSIGFGTVLLGVIVAMIPKAIELIQKLTGMADAEKEVARGAEIAKGRLDKMVDAAQLVADARLEGLRASLEGIKATAESTLATFNAIQAAADKLDDAEKAAALAQNANDPALSEQERAKRDLEIRRDFDERRRQRQTRGLDAQVENARSVRDQTQAEEGAAADRFRAQQEIVARDEARKSLANQLPGLLEQQKELQDQLGRLMMSGETSGASAQWAAELLNRIGELGRQIEAIRPVSETVNSEQGKATAAGNRALFEGREKELAEANRVALEAASKLESILKSTSIEKALIELSRGPQAAKEDSDQAKAMRDAAEKDRPAEDAATIERIIRQFIDAGAARLGNGSNDLSAGAQAQRSKFFDIQATGDFGTRARTPEELAQVQQLMQEIAALQNTYRDASARVFGDLAAMLRSLLEAQQSNKAALDNLDAQVRAGRR